MNKNELVSWIFRELCREEEKDRNRKDWSWNRGLITPLISAIPKIKQIAMPIGMTHFCVPKSPAFVGWSEFRYSQNENLPDKKYLFIRPMAYDEETNTLYKIIYEKG